MPSKSIFRQPGARHFQLVHRSQRDPEILNPEASKHVLKEFERENIKGKSRADLERVIPTAQLAHDLERANIGEAAVFGVYYDDTNYDYMQHLKPVGAQEDGVESILIEAPIQKYKGKAARSKDPIQLIELPPETLPSTSELPRDYESQQAVPASIAGFQPDMDPHLRQTLEALEDNAFVDDNLEDDFFGELVNGGERNADEDINFEFHEWGDVDCQDEHTDELPEGENWQAAFNRFKHAQTTDLANGDSDSDIISEGEDTVCSIPQFSVIGGKKRRKGSSDASGYSMSSSSMFRNQGLMTLDEQFDQMSKEYASDDDSQTHSDSDEAPELLNTREDFGAMMSQFMEEYEILGGKMKPVLEGDTAIQKLDTLRRALGEVLIRGEDGNNGDDDDDISLSLGDNDVEDRWDCETVLTTYSNLENHPRLIRARDPKTIAKIRLDPKTGLPSVGTVKPQKSRPLRPAELAGETEEVPFPAKSTVARPRDESTEDKKARKQAVRAEKQTRRAEKKRNKELFSAEMHNQTKSLANKEKMRVKKL